MSEEKWPEPKPVKSCPAHGTELMYDGVCHGTHLLLNEQHSAPAPMSKPTPVGSWGSSGYVRVPPPSVESPIVPAQAQEWPIINAILYAPERDEYWVIVNIGEYTFHVPIKGESSALIEVDKIRNAFRHHAAQRETELEHQLATAKRILRESIKVIGGVAEDDVSLEFLSLLPEELRLQQKRNLKTAQTLIWKGKFPGRSGERRMLLPDKTLTYENSVHPENGQCQEMGCTPVEI